MIVVAPTGMVPVCDDSQPAKPSAVTLISPFGENRCPMPRAISANPVVADTVLY